MSRMLWSQTFVGSFLRWRSRHRWLRIDVIPDAAILWRAIKPDLIHKKTGEIKPSYFRDNRGGYSCDLAAFSTPEKSRRGYARPSAWDGDTAGLVQFSAGDVRGCASSAAQLDVEHAPLDTPRIHNYSHAQFTRILSATEEAAMVKHATLLIKPK